MEEANKETRELQQIEDVKAFAKLPEGAKRDLVLLGAGMLLSEKAAEMLARSMTAEAAAV